MRFHHYATLDLLDQGALDRLVALVSHADLLPDRMKSAFFFERTTAPSWSSRCSRKTSTSSPSFREWGSLNSSSGTEPSDLKPTSRIYRVIGYPEDLGFDDLAFDDLRHGALVHARASARSLRRCSLRRTNPGERAGR